jgi:hypothetical protein
MHSVAGPETPIQPNNGTAFRQYQRTLPYAAWRADADGQCGWSLWGDGEPDGPCDLADALTPAAELVAALAADENQLELFARDGVRRDAKWRRDSEGGPANHRSWRELDRALLMRARYSGRPWCDGDSRTLADAYAQTWSAADIGRVWTSNPWIVDAVVCPISGELVRFPRSPHCRTIVDVLIAAFDAGTGGVLTSHDAWAARLNCCVRSVTTYMQALVAVGWVTEHWTRRAHPERGTARGHKLYRLGPTGERYVSLLTAARRGRSSGGVRVAGRLFAREVAARAARRRFDLAGATYRGRFRRAESTRANDARTRVGRAQPKRQTSQHSPPLTGLANYGPPLGDREEELAPLAPPVAVRPDSPASPARAAHRSNDSAHPGPPRRPQERGGLASGGESAKDFATLAAQLGEALGFDAEACRLG